MYTTIQVCVVFAAVLTCNGLIQAKNATVPVQAKDLRRFLSDPSFVLRQINCVLGKAECDRLGEQIRRATPEVINRNCARCSPVQASNAKKLINFIRSHYSTSYREIVNKYRRIRGSTKRGQQVKKTTAPTKILSPQSPTPSIIATTSSTLQNVNVSATS